MSVRLRFVVAAFYLLAGCGSGPDELAESGPVVALSEPARANDLGTGARNNLLISSRTYTGGNVKVKVSGFFEVDGTQTLNLPASITDDGQTWLQYGESGAQELNVLFTNSEELGEHGVSIGFGSYTVTAPTTEGECRTKFEVTATSVAGQYSCTGSTSYDKRSGGMGNVYIEVEFHASS